MRKAKTRKLQKSPFLKKGDRKVLRYGEDVLDEGSSAIGYGELFILCDFPRHLLFCREWFYVFFVVTHGEKMGL